MRRAGGVFRIVALHQLGAAEPGRLDGDFRKLLVEFANPLIAQWRGNVMGQIQVALLVGGLHDFIPIGRLADGARRGDDERCGQQGAASQRAMVVLLPVVRCCVASISVPVWVIEGREGERA